MCMQQKQNSTSALDLGNQTVPKHDDVWGVPLAREEILQRLQRDGTIYNQFLSLSEPFQEEMMAFCMGVKGVKMTYDPFFKAIFNPLIHPERLESFISECLRQKVKIMKVIPNESIRLTEDSSLLVMDIVVQLMDGAIANVEIQRLGYLFPGARSACYSSDLLMRQYSQVKNQKRNENQTFSYKDIKKVYTIVLMQSSTREFQKKPDRYLHYAKQTFDSGLEFDLLQEYLFVPLDIFLQRKHNKISRLDAWLYFIASDKLEDIQRIIEAYPEFQELYREVFRFRYHMKELVGMFSEALRILDKNTVQYMIEEQQKEIEVQRAELLANHVKIEAQNAEIGAKAKEIESQQAEIESQQAEIESQQAEIESQQAEIESQQAEIESQQAEIESQQAEIEAQRAEIARLRALLEENINP